MKKIIQLSIAGLIAATLFQSCQKESQTTPAASVAGELKSNLLNTFYGPSVPMGNGVIRAWVQQDKAGVPLAVGISLSEKALDNLPADPATFVLFFPPTKGKNFYQHMLVDWNPQGHEPPMYQVPHFDFHFYIIPNQDRLAIGSQGTAPFDVVPDAKYVPADYWKIPGGVPQMGAHWVDLTSPEFHGSPFTKTFIWGSYNGNFIFWEPMITREYLLSHPDDLVTLKQPEAYQRDGYYATKMKITYSTAPGEYTISLADLVYQAGQ